MLDANVLIAHLREQDALHTAATQRLETETGLRLPDCCVLLAAEEARGGVLTFDERLARAAAERGLAS